MDSADEDGLESYPEAERPPVRCLRNPYLTRVQRVWSFGFRQGSLVPRRPVALASNK